ILTAHGFRTADAVPEPAGELPLPRVDTVLAPADPTVDDVLVALRLAPVSPRKVTMVVDTSTSMGTSAGDGTRLTATAGALREAMRRASINSVMGMYVFADTPEGHRVAVIRDGLTAAKRAAMSSILDDIDLVDREPVATRAPRPRRRRPRRPSRRRPARRAPGSIAHRDARAGRRRRPRRPHRPRPRAGRRSHRRQPHRRRHHRPGRSPRPPPKAD